MHLVAVDAESSSACQSLVTSGALHSITFHQGLHAGTLHVLPDRVQDCPQNYMNVLLTGKGLPNMYLEVLGLLVLHESLFIAEHPVAVVTPRGLLVLLLPPLPDHCRALTSHS